MDNVRNTQVGHILIDYRICCAMLNFNMKPCIPDGNDSAQIAKRIRKRCLKSQNKLDSLLEMRFTSTLQTVVIQTINDFPKLSHKEIQKHVTLGSFKLKQCQSYLGQLIEYGKAYFLNDQLVQKYVTNMKVKQEMQVSKIIAFLIPSRHKRGKKWKPQKETNKENGDQNTVLVNIDPKDFSTYYKVFIQYVSVNDIEKAQQHKILKINSRPYHLIKSKWFFNLEYPFNSF